MKSNLDNVPKEIRTALLELDGLIKDMSNKIPRTPIVPTITPYDDTKIRQSIESAESKMAGLEKNVKDYFDLAIPQQASIKDDLQKLLDVLEDVVIESSLQKGAAMVIEKALISNGLVNIDDIRSSQINILSSYSPEEVSEFYKKYYSEFVGAKETRMLLKAMRDKHGRR